MLNANIHIYFKNPSYTKLRFKISIENMSTMPKCPGASNGHCLLGPYISEH